MIGISVLLGKDQLVLGHGFGAGAMIGLLIWRTAWPRCLAIDSPTGMRHHTSYPLLG
jgi:hypothetical protein